MHYDNKKYLGEIATMVSRFHEDCQQTFEVYDYWASMDMQISDKIGMEIEISFYIDKWRNWNDEIYELDWHVDAKIIEPIAGKIEFYIDDKKIDFDKVHSSNDVVESGQFQDFIQKLKEKINKIFEYIMEVA